MAYFPSSISLHDVTEINVVEVRKVDHPDIGPYTLTRIEIIQKGCVTGDAEMGMILDCYSPIRQTTNIKTLEK